MADHLKTLVQQYFEQVVDGRSELLQDFFSTNCVVHRAELPEPLRGLEQLKQFFAIARRTIRRTSTEIDALIAEPGQVVARVRHKATFDGSIMTPIGLRDVTGKNVEWKAMAMFRFTDDKIAEEWVIRDEVGIFRQLGLIAEIAGLAKRFEQ
jgi:predicted ester cyclase